MAADNRPRDQLDAQWNLHTSRQIDASKGAVTAITLLNSGSWLALLTQIDNLAKVGDAEKAAGVLLAWGIGALLGTLPWVCIYFNVLVLWSHDQDRNNRLYQWGINATICAGVLLALGSLFCFLCGLWGARSILLTTLPSAP